MELTISLAQMHIQLGQPEANFTQAREWVIEAARRHSQMILFPELWTSGYDLANARSLAAQNTALLPQLARLSREQSIAIGGSLLLERDGKVYNSFLFFTPNGDQPSLYEKIHLFRLMDEHHWLAPGSRLQQVSPDYGQAGLAVCYDLRFPEMFRRYALAGASLLLISAEWPLARSAHWQTLLRARAIENQIFVAATNCEGQTGGETFGGCSALISPWGETILEGPSNQPALLTAAVDLDIVTQVRQRIPVFKDRRPDIYGQL